MAAHNSNSRPIYSTEGGALCPECGKQKKNCACLSLKKTAPPPTAARLCVRYETAGRKGKGVTVISGLALNENDLLDLAKKLKQRFGTGGTVKNFTIELQGNYREQVDHLLQTPGFTA